MNWNRLHLTHAQQTIALLLESVIDAGKGLKLAKLEGDAAFFWAPDGNACTNHPISIRHNTTHIKQTRPRR